MTEIKRQRDREIEKIERGQIERERKRVRKRER